MHENNGRISTDRLNRFSSGKRECSIPKQQTFTKKVKLEVKPRVKPKVKRKISGKLQSVEHRLSLGLTSSSSETEDFSLNNPTDTETFSDNSAENTSTIQGSSQGSNQLSILEEHYYAVQYEEDWFVGRILQRVDKSKFKMKFLKLELGSYIWPKQDDIADVDQEFIFYGPLKLSGTGVFNLNRLDVINIKKLYKDLKRK